MKKLLFPTLLFILFVSCNNQKQTIYQFRGENRDGHYDESKLLSQWAEEGPELLWSADGIGLGYAAPVITDQQIFINGEKDSMSYLLAFDLQGKLQWKVENGPEFMGSGFSSTYPGARTTPVVVDDLVYTTSGQGSIICCTASSGEVMWRVNMVSDLDGYIPYFGIAESPAIDENNLYCFPSGTKNNFVALDRFTGEMVWSSPALQDTASFSSPIFINYPDRKVLVSMSHYYLFGLDSKDGKLVWKFDIQGYRDEGDHCNTPVFYKGNIYQIFGDTNSEGAVRLNLSADGSKVSKSWANDKIKNNFDGFILHDDHLFTTTRGNHLYKIELEHGQIVDSVNVATGGLIFADNKFFCYGNNGDMSMVNYQDGKFAAGGTFKVKLGNRQHFSHPVLAQGVMYLRHGDVLMAYKVANPD